MLRWRRWGCQAGADNSRHDNVGTAALGCPALCTVFARSQQLPLSRTNASLSAEPVVLLAVFAASSAAAGCAFAPSAPSVADAAARLAACGLHLHFASPVAGAPCPAAVEVFAALCPVARTACPAAFDISGPSLDYRCLDEPGVR